MKQASVSAPVNLGVIVLAAGRSARMGRPKLLLPWGTTSILGHLLEVWRCLGARQVVVVCAAGDATLAGELDRLGFPAADWVVNPAPEQGMFSSIQCAARWDGWSAGLSHWAIILGDQPHLQANTLRRLIDLAAAEPGKICQPSRDGQRRHPVLLPKAVFKRLAESGANNLKEFLGAGEIASFESDDAGLDLDIDRPEDYSKAKALAAGKL